MRTPRTYLAILVGLLALTACRAAGQERARAVEMTTLTYVEGSGADPVKHRLDLFRPQGASDAPVLLYFHGGVWQRGDKDQYRNIGEAFARRGILTAVVNYRLTPTVRHPGHAQDAARAVAWVMREAAAYGGRADQVYLSGHSAGGHLITLLLFDARYLKAEGIDAETLAGVVPLSGVFDLTKPIDDTPEGGFTAHVHPPFGTDRRVLEIASPIRHLHPTRVPLLVILAGDDYKDMQRQSQMFIGALQEKKIPATFETILGKGHFPLVQSIGREGDPTTDLIADFVLKSR